MSSSGDAFTIGLLGRLEVVGMRAVDYLVGRVGYRFSLIDQVLEYLAGNGLRVSIVNEATSDIPSQSAADARLPYA